MRVSDKSYSRQSLKTISDLNTKINELRLAISSGQRIETLSDDPVAMNKAILTQTSLDKTNQYVKNVSSLDAYSSNLDNSLGVMEQSLMEIRTMAVSSTITTDNATRLDIASQINSKIELFIEEGNQQYEGQYVFSGTAVDKKPFSAVYSGDNVVAVNYNGNNNHLKREIGDNLFVKYNVTGGELLGGVKDDINPLEVMMSLRDNIAYGTVTSTNSMKMPGGTDIDTTAALNTQSLAKTPSSSGTIKINDVDINWADTDSMDTIISNINASGAGVTAKFDTNRQKLLITPDDVDTPVKIEDVSGNLAEVSYLADAPTTNNEFLDTIDSSFNSVLSLRTKTGINQNKLSEAESRLQTKQTNAQQTINDEVGTDFAKAISQMLNYETSLEGALNVKSRMSNLSLMDFLS